MKRSRINPSRKPIAHRSAKMQAKYDGPDGRRALVVRLLERYPVCQFSGEYYVNFMGKAVLQYHVCANPSQDAHEVLSRARGGSILDENNILMLCRPHHSWVSEHPAEATKLGLLKSRWGKHEEAEK